jgi:hypothetical protein
MSPGTDRAMLKLLPPLARMKDYRYHFVVSFDRVWNCNKTAAQHFSSGDLL